MADSPVIRTRRSRLRRIAELQRDHFHATSCSALVTIVTISAHLVRNSNQPADDMMDDLYAVLIGSGYFKPDRSKGPYFAGHFRPASGFKQQYFDSGNQVQHLFAGMYLAYKHHAKGDSVLLLSIVDEFRKKQQQDAKLYYTARALGKWLRNNKSQYAFFSKYILKKICVANTRLHGVGK